MSKLSLKGFDSLSKGSFENGGQNLYVSKKGVLQRIWRFDINNDGYVDLLIANSHDYTELPKQYLLEDPLGDEKITEILAHGPQTADVGAVRGIGADDLVIAAAHDGQHGDLASYVYFGGKDGISEDRRIDLAAPSCFCCGIGDFDGDGKKEIVYLVADNVDESSPNHLSRTRLRVYSQDEDGFRMTSYKDYPTGIAFFSVADVDGDGCDDLICRTDAGAWLVLWGGKDGFSDENSTEFGAPTNDTERFEILPFGGGNLRYTERAMPKQLKLGGENYLFYADAEAVTLVHFSGRTADGKDIRIEAANVIAAATGHLAAADSDDLVLLQINSKEDQHALIYYAEDGYRAVRGSLATVTPRDALLYDFSGTGRDDIVIVQGRSDHAFTSESLIYPVDANGRPAEEPRRYVTHNCVGAKLADFRGDGKKSLLFINQQQSSAYGHIPVYAYLGSAEGYKPENRLEFPGHSAGCMLPVDFNDDGWPDLLILQNGEDQPFLNMPGDLYFGGPEGFDLSKKQELPLPLAWGGHCIDSRRTGYLDVIACCGKELRILYGGPEGYSEDRMLVLYPAGDDGPAGCLWPAIADLNGNGWPDLVVPLSARPFSRIYWGGPEGYSNERSCTVPIECALTVRIADLNKDGYPDLIFGSRASMERNLYQEGTVTIFWGGPEGYSGYNCCVLPSYQSNCITIGDLNGDGWLDIFASSYFNKKERDINSFIFWNDKGHFSQTNKKRIFSHSSSAAWAGDFNEDGYVDLCVTHHRAYGSHVTESAIWWNGPEGFKEENRTWLPTIGPHDMVPNDMGNVMTRGPEEAYTTEILEFEGLQKVGWVAEIPEKTWVSCRIRTADSPEALADKPFIGKDGTEESRFENGEEIPAELIAGRFVQARIYLGAVNSGSSPRITEITLE